MIENRRRFLKTAGLAGAAFVGASTRSAWGQSVAAPNTLFVETTVLRIGYESRGAPGGFPIVLLHGFPDDVRAWDGVVPPLVRAGYRTLVPYLRGYGPTRFRDAAAPRMAEQAAIGQDVIDFADALRLTRFAVAGYDWGGRAAAIAAALHPDRVRATVLVGGYTIQNTLVARRLVRRKPNTARGISGISTPSGGGPVCRPIGGPSVVSCGNCGRRTGTSPTTSSIARRRRSTILTSSTP
jgi:pimeloyl-ACP methyl ester carboxylesterase